MGAPTADGLRSLLARLEEDHGLFGSGGLLRRIEALDRLDGWLDGDPVRDAEHGSGRDAETRARALALRARLEAADLEECATIREEIRAGDRGALPRAAGRSAGSRRAASDAGDGYDHLDALVGEVLGFELAGGEIGTLPADMVPYQPTPVRHVLDLFDRLALTEHDVLVDLGSGLGQVPLLTGACTPARAVGVEIESAYVDAARRCADRLDLTAVTFTNQDARDADISAGTVFYLYTPFTGPVLRTVLDALRGEAAQRPLRVCAYGPCTPVVTAEDWLEPVEGDDAGAVVILRARRPQR